MEEMDNLRTKIASLGWSIHDINFKNSIGWELFKFSPAGEDFSFTIEHNNNVKQAKEEIIRYANEFDEDEHIEMWVEAKRNRADIPSIKILVQDAKDIQEMLYELCDKIKEE